jgi:CRP-like cAMP-binding protein
LATVENHLIELLTHEDRQSLLAVSESVPLIASEELCERGKTARHVYFPTDGFISLVTQIDHHPGLEVGMIGREGMLGAPVALGVAVSPMRAMVQGPGSAWRIDSDTFVHELTHNESLQRGINRYIHVRMTQLAASAACVRFHLIGPRLARWLLMSQDRSHADRFRVTHEFLAYVLGVRRVGITMAAIAMQRSGLIEYHRGDLTVLNRTGLEAVACSCYAAEQLAYTNLIG